MYSWCAWTSDECGFLAAAGGPTVGVGGRSLTEPNLYLLTFSSKIPAVLLLTSHDKWSRGKHLDTEGQPVLLEGVEVQNQLLTSFSQRTQVSVAVHKDGSSLQNLRGTACGLQPA